MAESLEKPFVGFKPFNEGEDTRIFRINLPHWRQNGATYFLTWRLADSLPLARLKQLDAEQKAWLQAHDLESRSQVESLPEKLRHEYHRRFTAVAQEWLDAGEGDCLLRRRDCAQILVDALNYFDGERYLLDAFVVMPNHVHLLVTAHDDWELSKLLHTWKGYSSHAINKILERSGSLWQQESWDHIVRSEAQLDHYRRYIRENPVKARLRTDEFLLGCGKGIPSK